MPGKPQASRDRIEKCSYPAKRFRSVQQKRIGNENGRDAKIDDVGKRIHLHAEFRRCLQKPCDPTIDPVEEGCQQHHRDSEFEPSLEGKSDPGEAGADRQHRDQVGDHQADRDLAQARTTGLVGRMVLFRRRDGRLHQMISLRLVRHDGRWSVPWRSRIRPIRFRRRPLSGQPRRALGHRPEQRRQGANRSGSGRSAHRR